MARRHLGEFELQVLQVLVRHPRDAYGVAILNWLAEAGRPASVGALYTTLERLEGKGLVKSEWGEATPERGGRRKRNYTITGQGASAVRAAEAARSSFASYLGGVPHAV